MKKRNGFVSNSSSSSFICDFCGRDESGWDLCLDEAEMFKCENGHTICLDHAKKDLPDDSYDVSPKCCPICCFDKVTPQDLSSYLLKKLSVTSEEITKEIKGSFKSFTAFQKHLSKK
jgi:hypothetical protein